MKPDSRSRGLLTTAYLAGTSGAPEYCDAVDVDEYNGFNLVVGSVFDAHLQYLGQGTRGKRRMGLDRGVVYGVSNGLLTGNSESGEWPKVAFGKQLFRTIIDEVHSHTRARKISPPRWQAGEKTRKELADALIATLLANDRACALPDGMFDPLLEAQLCRNCVPLIPILGTGDTHKSAGPYATRTHTVIIVDKHDRVLYVEVELYSRGEDGAFIPAHDRRDIEFELQH